MLQRDKRYPLDARAQLVENPINLDVKLLYLSARKVSGREMVAVEVLHTREFVEAANESAIARVLAGKLRPMVTALQAYHYSSLWC
jgi:hypothetical protein